MLFALSTLGLVYVILSSDPEQILDDNHLALSMMPAVCGVAVGALYLVVSFASGVLPVLDGFAGDLFGLIAGPFGTPWWYYVLSTLGMFALHSVTKHNEVAAVRDLREDVDAVRSDLDEAVERAEDGNADAAVETLEDLEPRLRSMRRTATEHDLPDLGGEISTLQQKRRRKLEELTED